MFNSNNWQFKLVYTGFGGFLMLIGMLLSPVTAQREKFGEIVCTKLSVVDKDGIPVVILSSVENGGTCSVLNTDGEVFIGHKVDPYYLDVKGVFIGISERGGSVQVVGKDWKSQAVLGVDEQGGNVAAYGNDLRSAVKLATDEHGGHVTINGKDGKSRVFLGIN